MNISAPDDAALRERLGPAVAQRLPWMQWLAEIDSTNAALLRDAAALPDRAVLGADRQTAGRGRRGRAWDMAGDGNLAMSLFARLHCRPDQLAGLSLAVGVGCAEALRRLGVAAVGLKWPNDLVADDRKLGGVLIELAGSRATGSEVVIGLGLNRALPPDADPGWIGLRQLRCELDRPALVAEMIGALLGVLDEFEASGLATFLPRWDSLDALRNRSARVVTASAEQAGTVLGIRADGALRLATAQGEQCFHSAEVSLRRQ